MASNYQQQDSTDWGIIWFPGCSNFQVISPINVPPFQRVPPFAPPFQARNISAFPSIQLFNLGAGLESIVKGTSWCWYIYLHFPEDRPDVGKYHDHGSYGTV